MEQILIPIEEKIGELKREIKFLRRAKQCPFYSIFGNKIRCIYKDKRHSCQSIAIAPGNGDAWCAKRINKSFGGKFPTD